MIGLLRRLSQETEAAAAISASPAVSRETKKKAMWGMMGRFLLWMGLAVTLGFVGSALGDLVGGPDNQAGLIILIVSGLAAIGLMINGCSLMLKGMWRGSSHALNGDDS